MREWWDETRDRTCLDSGETGKTIHRLLSFSWLSSISALNQVLSIVLSLQCVHGDLCQSKDQCFGGNDYNIMWWSRVGGGGVESKATPVFLQALWHCLFSFVFNVLVFLFLICLL